MWPPSITPSWTPSSRCSATCAGRSACCCAIRAKGDPGALPAEEREIVTYIRQLMRTNRAEQSAFDALEKRHGAQWLVELTAAANYFALLSGVVNAFEVAPPPDGDRLP
jgi:hypothetical protein